MIPILLALLALVDLILTVVFFKQPIRYVFFGFFTLNVATLIIYGVIHG